MLSKMKVAMRWLLDEQARLRTDQELFDPAGLEALGETVADATTLILKPAALVRLFHELPHHLQSLARRYGLQDQFVADQLFGWLEANAHTVPEVMRQLQSGHSVQRLATAA